MLELERAALNIKHLPNKHNQKTHGRVKNRSNNKSIERAKKWAVPLIEKVGVFPIKALIGVVFRSKDLRRPVPMSAK